MSVTFEISNISTDLMKKELESIAKKFYLPQSHEIQKSVKSEKSAKNMLQKVMELFREMIQGLNEVHWRGDKQNHIETVIDRWKKEKKNIVEGEIKGFSNRFEKLVEIISDLTTPYYSNRQLVKSELMKSHGRRGRDNDLFVSSAIMNLKISIPFVSNLRLEKIRSLFERNILFSSILFHKTYRDVPLKALMNIYIDWNMSQFPDITDLNLLEILTINSSKIKEIPNHISSSSLKVLKVENNEFSFDFQKIMKQFTALIYLEVVRKKLYGCIFRDSISTTQIISSSSKFKGCISFCREIHVSSKNLGKTEEFGKGKENFESQIQKPSTGGINLFGYKFKYYE